MFSHCHALISSVARDIGWRCVALHFIPVVRSWCGGFHSLRLSPSLTSSFFHSLVLHFHLLCGLIRWDVPFTQKNAWLENQRRLKKNTWVHQVSSMRRWLCVCLQGRRMQIAVNRVLRARGKMVCGKCKGPADCLIVEMLNRLPTEVICEVTHRFRISCRFLKAQETWWIWRLVFLWSSSRSLMQDWRRASVVSIRLLYRLWFPSGTLLSWWLSCSRRISWLNGWHGKWELRGVRIVSTCKVCWRTYCPNTGYGMKIDVSIWNWVSSRKRRSTWQVWMSRWLLTWQGRRWFQKFFLWLVLTVSWWPLCKQRCTSWKGRLASKIWRPNFIIPSASGWEEWRRQCCGTGGWARALASLRKMESRQMGIVMAVYFVTVVRS